VTERDHQTAGAAVPTLHAAHDAAPRFDDTAFGGMTDYL
jgi:hypothetical protein